VTRSANDAAVVIAESIAGDEDGFAKLMTRKARALGMSRTTYRNASGLPDDEQVTSARDQRSSAAPSGPLSALLSLFLDRDLQLSRPVDPQTTIICSARSRASTASRPAIRVRRASTS